MASPVSNARNSEGSDGAQPPGPPSESPTLATTIATATTVDIQTASPWCVLIPLGATEQHGPHLPLATDTIIAHRWALAAAELVPGVIVAPPLAYGSSGEHQGFAGTVSIGREALTAVVIEIARSIRHDYDAAVFVSGHGGNVPVLDTAISQLRTEGHIVDWISPRWNSVDLDGQDLPQLDAHAGCTETSLLLYLEPRLVRPYKDVTGNTRPLGELFPMLRNEGLTAVTTSGVLGDPAEATADHGSVLFLALVEDLVNVVQQLRTTK